MKSAKISYRPLTAPGSHNFFHEKDVGGWLGGIDVSKEGATTLIEKCIKLMQNSLYTLGSTYYLTFSSWPWLATALA